MKRSTLFAKESILLRKLQETRKLAWEHKPCFNCLKGNYEAKCCPSENDVLRNTVVFRITHCYMKVTKQTQVLTIGQTPRVACLGHLFLHKKVSDVPSLSQVRYLLPRSTSTKFVLSHDERSSFKSCRFRSIAKDD